MIHDWWVAHRLEVYIDLGAIAFMLAVMIPVLVFLAWRKDRRRKSKDQ